MEDIRFVFDAITAIIQQVKAEVFLERFNVMLIIQFWQLNVYRRIVAHVKHHHQGNRRKHALIWPSGWNHFFDTKENLMHSATKLKTIGTLK